MTRPSLRPDENPIHEIDRRTDRQQPFGDALTADDPDVIRQWAERHAAEPATGEATPSGPATVNVEDGGAGIRFNFPGAAPFRPITWDEWFENFRRHDLLFLLFVYEPDVPGQPRYRLMPREKTRAAQTPR